MADDAFVDKLLGSLSGIESGGDYAAVGKPTESGDRAYGKYQVMGKNVPTWSKEALGVEMTPDAYLADPDAQEKVVRHRIGKYADEHGGSAKDVAALWHSGVPYDQAVAEGRKDILGTRTQDYADRVEREVGAAPTTTTTTTSDDDVKVRLPDGSLVNLGVNPTPELRARVKAKILEKWPELAKSKTEAPAPGETSTTTVATVPPEPKDVRSMSYDEMAAEYNRARGKDDKAWEGKVVANVAKPGIEAIHDFVDVLKEAPTALTDVSNPAKVQETLTRIGKLLRPLAIPGEAAGNLTFQAIMDATNNPTLAALGGAAVGAVVGIAQPIPFGRTEHITQKGAETVETLGKGASEAQEAARLAREAAERAPQVAGTAEQEAARKATKFASEVEERAPESVALAAPAERIAAETAAADAERAAAAAENAKAMAGRAEEAKRQPAPKGVEVSADAYRIGQESAPGRGTFYGDSPESAREYAHPGNQGGVSKTRLEFKNALQFSENQLEAAESLAEHATPQERKWLEAASKLNEYDEPNYTMLDKVIARIAKREGYDGIVYENEHLAQGQREFVDLASVDLAPQAPTLTPAEQARKAAEAATKRIEPSTETATRAKEALAPSGITEEAGASKAVTKLGEKLAEVKEPVQGVYESVAANNAHKTLDPARYKPIYDNITALEDELGPTLTGQAKITLETLKGKVDKAERLSYGDLEDLKQQLDTILPGRVPHNATPRTAQLYDFKFKLRDEMRSMVEGEEKEWLEAADAIWRDEIVGKDKMTALGNLVRLAKKTDPAVFIERVFGNGKTAKQAAYAKAIFKHLGEDSAAIRDAWWSRAMNTASDAEGNLDPKKLLDAYDNLHPNFRKEFTSPGAEEFFRVEREAQKAAPIAKEGAAVAEKAAKAAKKLEVASAEEAASAARSAATSAKKVADEAVKAGTKEAKAAAKRANDWAKAAQDYADEVTKTGVANAEKQAKLATQWADAASQVYSETEAAANAPGKLARLTAKGLIIVGGHRVGAMIGHPFLGAAAAHTVIPADELARMLSNSKTAQFLARLVKTPVRSAVVPTLINLLPEMRNRANEERKKPKAKKAA